MNDYGELTIRTNHHWRPFRYRSEVPESVLASQFDYQDSEDTYGFFRYLGTWYHTDQFMRTENPGSELSKWDGYHGDSYFSGILIRISKEGDSYQVGRYYR